MVRTREEILQSYSSDHDRLLAAKTLDKLHLVERTWDLVRGDFYDPAQIHLIKELLIPAALEPQFLLFETNYSPPMRYVP
ncbi:MAG: hypothetical protein KGZ53_08245 [Peptococcaceae bacterium]|nr:hypothetical protein [Peptococcaceae bacterium]